MNYQEFLKTKMIGFEPSGFEMQSVNSKLFDWQSDIDRWLLKKGRAALFADCGLGKTPMQLHWAQEVVKHTGKPVLILAPLAVAQQTFREGKKFDIEIAVCREMSAVLYDRPDIANYEMLQHFDASKFGGVVLDESSILKHHDSKTRQALTDAFKDTPYKLCCTATPSPNDFMELGTHAQFLGVMSQTEMLATFFVHDGGDTAKWRLKGHAEAKFFEWVASWACCLTKPQDLGYEQDGYDLPQLNVHEIVIKSDNLVDADGQMMLLSETTQGLNERRAARRYSIDARIKKAAEIALLKALG